MQNPSSRRDFLKTSGAISATALLGVPLAGCGGHALPGSEQMLAWTSTQAVAAIRAGTVSAELYVSALIARAKTMGDLNAMITLDEAGALAAARRIDAERAAGKPVGALAGLAIVVKDNINTQGLKTTGGTPALANLQPARHAPTLQKLVDAGAVILGKSNLHELAFGITSTNFTLGRNADGSASKPCRNPYDKTRSPGGSSGGTAVAIAARFAAAGLGTDTGGSTRIPAAFCGIAGLRPSVGNGGAERRYNDENAVVPISHTRDTVGPMARTVADLALLDAVITGTEVPRARSLQGLRLGLPASFWAGLDSGVKAVAEAARQKLQQAGVVFVEADLSGVMTLNDQISFQVALTEPKTDLPAYLKANQSSLTLADVSAGLSSPDVKGAFGAILADAFAAQYPDAIAVHRPALQKLYRDYFSAHKVEAVLFPTAILPAPVIDAVNGSSKVSINGGPELDEFGTVIRNTDPCSNAGIPSLSLPAGLTPAGLPVGLELDGPLGSDQNLLAIGMAMETVLGSVAAPRL